MATTITPTIVTLNTTVTSAPEPSQLQQSGAIVSTGGTSLTTGTYQYCGSLADVVALAAAGLTITSIAVTGTTATATVAAMTLTTGSTFLTTIAGCTPAALNGTFEATVVSSTTFSFTVPTGTGAATVEGTYTAPGVAFVTQAATTFFAQGNVVGVYVLELGTQGAPSDGITALTTWITDNPQTFYGFLVDSSWDGAGLNTLAAANDNPNSEVYFLLDTTEANLATYTGTKSVIGVVPAPSAPASEITAAAVLYNLVQNAPSGAAPMRPMQYRQIYGCTPWPSYGQSAAINAILTANGSLVYAGTEGGLPNSYYLWGARTMDGKSINFWYAVDWYQIQVKLALANAILNAANQTNPIVYNQQGINALETVANDVGNSAIAFGLMLTVALTAQSFATYTQQNPANYAAGLYGGFAATVTPQLGISQITFNIDATSFA